MDYLDLCNNLDMACGKKDEPMVLELNHMSPGLDQSVDFYPREGVLLVAQMVEKHYLQVRLWGYIWTPCRRYISLLIGVELLSNTECYFHRILWSMDATNRIALLLPIKLHLACTKSIILSIGHLLHHLWLINMPPGQRIWKILLWQFHCWRYKLPWNILLLSSMFYGSLRNYNEGYATFGYFFSDSSRIFFNGHFNSIHILSEMI
ncbi:hypothetical protein SLE2022_294080 [Rubroshorea leprosula]